MKKRKLIKQIRNIIELTGDIEIKSSIDSITTINLFTKNYLSVITLTNSEVSKMEYDYNNLNKKLVFAIALHLEIKLNLDADLQNEKINIKIHNQKDKFTDISRFPHIPHSVINPNIIEDDLNT